MKLTDYLTARRVQPISLANLPKIESDEEKFTCLEMDEGALKPGAATAQPRPGLFLIHTAQDLYDLYNKIQSSHWRDDETVGPIGSDVLNHLMLSYEIIRKKYPNTFRSL